MRRSTFQGWVLLVLGLLLLLPETSHAIPAFARKYKFSCTTCHAPIPRLKPYGDEFAANGFRLPEGQEPARAYRDTGDPLLQLQSDFPLAVRFDAWANWTDVPQESWDLKTPWGLKLLSGGTVSRDVSYYFYFYMSEQGEVSGVEDAFLQFNDLGGVSFDLMVGQFQLCDPMMKRELRLTFQDYLIYRVKPYASDANLTYDRGLMASYDFDFGLGLVGQLVNGNGKPVAGEEIKDYDSDKDKGYGARAIYGIGPIALGYYYYATREVLRGDTGASIWESSNEVEIHGPDLYFDPIEKLAFSAQYLWRSDSQPQEASGTVDTQGVVAEMVYLPRGVNGREALTLLYNWVDSDDPYIDADRITGALSYLLARNLRLNLEYTHDFDLEGDRVGLGLVSAF